MVKLDVVRSSNTSLVERQPIVAVFFGGTGYIGSLTIRALASAHAKSPTSKGLRAYIVGRNAKAGEKFLAECKAICPKGEFVFIQAEDMALMGEVDRLCGEVSRAEERHGADARIDYLMISQGGAIFKPRKGTLTP
jgi:hypothetical protein